MQEMKAPMSLIWQTPHFLVLNFLDFAWASSRQTSYLVRNNCGAHGGCGRLIPLPGRNLLGEEGFR
jgi:hypothetical protein